MDINPASPNQNLNQNPIRTVSGLFKNRELAEKAVDAIERLGYERNSFNVIMSRETQDRDFNQNHIETELGNKSLQGAGVGGAVGMTVGAALTALAAVGMTLTLPGMGLIIAGPLVAGLVGAGAGGFTGGLIGALAGAGIPEERVTGYDQGLRDGGILLSATPNSNLDGERIASEWKSIGGIDVHT